MTLKARGGSYPVWKGEWAENSKTHGIKQSPLDSPKRDWSFNGG
jgi:hypothetical protein